MLAQLAPARRPTTFTRIREDAWRELAVIGVEALAAALVVALVLGLAAFIVATDPEPAVAARDSEPSRMLPTATTPTPAVTPASGTSAAVPERP